jgi:spore germination cell wall hydrolase CwlJ-like protein
VRATFSPATFGDALRVDADDEHCLATAIYFEARGESEDGQKAVAEVILARTKTPGRPKSVCGVVYEGSERKRGCQFSFTCDRASNVAPFDAAWKRAKAIAAKVARGTSSLVRGATFYHATYVKPGWASRMVKVGQVGSHIFYRPQPGRHL